MNGAELKTDAEKAAYWERRAVALARMAEQAEGEDQAALQERAVCCANMAIKWRSGKCRGQTRRT